MKYLLSWAKQIAFTLVCAILCVSVLPAHAQQSIVKDWEYPGLFRYQGTPKQACEMFVSHGLLEVDCIAAIERGEPEVIYLQDGDIISTTFTSADKVTHGVSTLRVAFKDKETKEPLPPDHPMRRALVYKTGRADGAAIVLPDACGNWSIMIHRPPPAEDVLIPEPDPEPKPKMRWVCSTEHFHQSPDGHWYVHLPGVSIKGCSEMYVGGQSMDLSNNLQSNGLSDSCRWVEVSEE